jgi:L-aminopeptidase/D-esterase-like protein
MSYLEEHGRGFDVSVTTVPSVPTAILFDLSFGDHRVRPDWKMGYAAAASARGGVVEQGSVGAGTGATVGKAFGIENAMKGGVGTASISLPDGLVVGALVAVNAFGDVVDDETGEIMAGARDPKDKRRFADSFQAIKMGHTIDTFAMRNTTLGVVAANARLNREELAKVAQMANHAFAKVISPSHTNFDGDVVFALSVGEKEASLNSVGLLADEVCRRSVKKAIIEADGFGMLPSYRDLREGK